MTGGARGRQIGRDGTGAALARFGFMGPSGERIAPPQEQEPVLPVQQQPKRAGGWILSAASARPERAARPVPNEKDTI